jgi:hypothetical protein
MYMESPGINRIGIASNDDSQKWYADGAAFVRELRLEGPNCLASVPWVEDAIRDVNFALTLNNGCVAGDAYACGQGACFRTIPECDRYGNFNQCVPGYCTTDADCVYDWNNPSRGSYGPGSCNNPTGLPYEGLCQPPTPLQPGNAGFPETCNGIDDDCDGITDDELGDVSCGTGACATSVYSCTDFVGPDGFLHGTETNCVAHEPPPSPEACNGLDDDCDGITDDNLDALSCGTGTCTSSVYSCVIQAGSFSGTGSCPDWAGTGTCAVSSTGWGQPATCMATCD